MYVLRLWLVPNSDGDVETWGCRGGVVSLFRSFLRNYHKYNANKYQSAQNIVNIGDWIPSRYTIKQVRISTGRAPW